ncbi:hypothetical protein AOQ84DRAFT_397869 [Glonium stellatum]|uniref:2,6-dihydroxypyridine 3-monooxygenase substrate binding domain-containing protein n=1 Tax=Glonium stellatum TaxID=574774 RepID=A0A8E2JSZ9_9PEZI|nr:hypothetical protein AOQ84DRAFT_397869 [Glonium stellatum]
MLSKPHILARQYVGGSLGGLLAGVALKRLGHNIRILEHNPTPLLHDQGAGVVVGSDTQKFFQKYDLTNHPITVTSNMRHYLGKQGQEIYQEDSQQIMTSWGLLYHLLRANFDYIESEYCKLPEGLDTEGASTYDYGCTVAGADTQSEDASTQANVLIAADGASSTLRQMFFPKVKRKHAGYVAWRAGTFIEKFTFFHSVGTQILAYLIPGRTGSLEAGKWLQKKQAAESLPPQFAEIVQKTEVPFVQAITDVISPHSALCDGRILFVGDALAGFRPHTAASTSQAASKAMALSGLISGTVSLQE